MASAQPLLCKDEPLASVCPSGLWVLNLGMPAPWKPTVVQHHFRCRGAPSCLVAPPGFPLSAFGMSPSVTMSVTLPPCLHLRISALSRYPLPSSPPLPKSPLMAAFGLLILVIMFPMSAHSIWFFFMFLVFQSFLFF